MIPSDTSSRRSAATSLLIIASPTLESFLTWVEHFIHVLCKGRPKWRVWESLISGFVPTWTVLPTSWCHDFASVFLFSTVQPLDMHGLPAYQCAHKYMSLDERQAFLPFLATLLKLVKSSLTWASLTSFENWLDQLPESLNNQDAHTKMRHILATRKPQLTLELFATELPMAATVMSL